jgi:O-antigen/teichoic acid export membrane protein
MVASAMRQLAQPVNQAIFPKLTELYQQNEEQLLASTYHKANQFTAVLMGSAGVFVAIFGDSLLAIWTRDSVLATRVYPIMWILVVGMVMNGLLKGPYYLQMAAGWTGLLVRINAFMVIIFVPVVVWLSIEYRAIGAALAWCLLNLIYLLVVARFMHRRLLKNEMWHWYWKDLIFPLVPAIVVGGLVNQMRPRGGSEFVSAMYLLTSFALILLSSSLASEHVRATFLPKIRGLWRK